MTTTVRTPAELDIRVLPWRPRLRRIDPDALREGASDGDLFDADDIVGAALGVALTLAIVIAAPLLAIVLAIALLPAEVFFVTGLAAGLLICRFTGLVPWTVQVGDGTWETYRFLPSALRRVRHINGERRARVRWNWA